MEEKESPAATPEGEAAPPAKSTLRDTLYGRIDISLKTMNIVVAVSVGALVVCLILALFSR